MASFAGNEEVWSRPDLPSKCTYQLGVPLKDSPHHHLGKVERPKLLPDILHYIHNTPVVKLNKIPNKDGVECEIYAKCEFFNPGGSIKDRIALRMVEEAERTGKLKPGYTIIEPTSGNTGIGLSMVAAVRGYKCIIVMPEKMSKEKVDVMTALGSEIIRTPTGAAFDDPGSNIRIAEKLVNEIPNSIVLNQYKNPANPLAHYDHTAEEILDAFDNKLDMVVCSAGTGGTITGIARKIKERCPTCKVIGVDPVGSILAEPQILNDADITFYEVEGIGYDFLPTVFERKYVDKWYKSEDKPSFTMARRLMREEGLLCGGSSGSAMYCAIKAAKDFNLGPDQKVVVILPDSVRNYMTKFLSDDWLKMRSLYEGPDAINDYKWKNTRIKAAFSLPMPHIFPPDLTVRGAVESMKAVNQDFAVVATEDLILGTLTSNILMDSIAKNMIDYPVSNVMNSQYKVLTYDETLGQLSFLLDTDSHVLILRKDVHVKKSLSKRMMSSVRKSLLKSKRNPINVKGYAKCTHLASYLGGHMPRK